MALCSKAICSLRCFKSLADNLSEASSFWKEGTYEIEALPDLGTVAVKREGEGDRYGKVTIDGEDLDKIEKYSYAKQEPDGTISVWRKYDNPKIPDERTDNKTADEQVADYANWNNKGGINLQQWRAAAQPIYDELGGVDLATLNDEVHEAALADKDMLVNKLTKVTPIVEGIKNELKKPSARAPKNVLERVATSTASALGMGSDINNPKTFKVGNEEVTFLPQKGGLSDYYKIDYTTFKKLIPSDERKNFKYENMTPDDVVKLLTRLGYVTQETKKRQAQPEQATPAPKKSKFIP